MHNILKVLSQRMEHSLKQELQKRFEILMSGVRFEATRSGSSYKTATEKGWSLKRIEVICCLNSFYQIILGPLASSSRPQVGAGLLTDYPIAYGTKVKFTIDDSLIINECYNRFSYIIKNHGIDIWLLQASHAQDLLYRLANSRNVNG